MRLIDADALKYTRVRIFHGMNSDGTPLVGGMNAVVMSCAIKDATTIDAVEVVRCKDCKRNCGTQGDFIECVYWLDIVKPNDFCSYGERRDKCLESES